MGSEVITDLQTHARTISQSLLDLTHDLAISEVLPTYEKLRWLNIEVSFKAANLTVLNKARVEMLKQFFGNSIDLSISYEGTTYLRIEDSSFDDARLLKLQNSIGKDEDLLLRLNINKTKLQEHLSLKTDSQTQRVHLYLFSDRLPYLFSRTLSDCEEELWGDNSQSQVVVLVCNEDLLLVGDYLMICGGCYLPHWEEHLRKSSIEPVSLTGICASLMYKTCRSNLRWETRWVQHLTPLHFKVQNKADTTFSETSRVLALQEVSLALLYSADHTLKIQDRVWSLYQRGQTPIRVAWPPILEIAQSATEEKQIEEASQNLISLIEWIYEPAWSVDRLQMTQLYIAEELRNRQPEECLNFLLSNIERFRDDLRSRWKDVIAKKLDGYSEQERKLEEDVTKATQAYDDQIAAVIKSLTESGLATAAAIIGSFLAAIYKPPFDAKLFSLGLSVYAGYVLIFPVAIGLSHHWGRFASLQRQFHSQTERIKKRLDEKKVKDILDNSQLQINETRFKRWFLGACVVHFILIGLAVLGAVVVPRFIH